MEHFFAAGARRLPPTGRHRGGGVTAIRLRADPSTDRFPLRAVTRGRAGDRVGNLVQNRVVDQRLIVRYNKVPQQLDPLGVIPTNAQHPLGVIEPERPAVEGVPLHQ